MDEKEIITYVANLGRASVDINSYFDIFPNFEIRVSKKHIYAARKLLGETIPDYWEAQLKKEENE